MNMSTGSEDASTFRTSLGRRIGEAAARYPTKRAAAEQAGVTLEQFNRWIAGDVKVPLEGLWGLANGADGIDFYWLCVGPSRSVTPLHQPGQVFQESVLRDVLAALATVIVEEGVTFAPSAFPDLVFDLHQYVIDRRTRDGAEADLSGITHFMTLAARSQRSQQR